MYPDDYPRELLSPDQRAFIKTLRLPSIQLTPHGNEPVFSRLGGQPDLAPEIFWPIFGDKPLAFLCQIDLSEMAAQANPVDLPAQGLLYVFYDQEKRARGRARDRGKWRILYSRSPVDECRETEAPEGFDTPPVYAPKPVAFRTRMSYPGIDSDAILAMRLSRAQEAHYEDMRLATYGDDEVHVLLGHPELLQTDGMAYECEIQSHGGKVTPRTPSAQQAEDTWQLLLQLSSDNDTGMMWGEGGILYFWIRRADLQAQRFDDVWLQFQSRFSL